MNRSEFAARAKAKGFGKKDDKGKKLPPQANAKKQLREELIDYYTNDPEGQEAWAKRPRITGEGVADYITIESMVDAVLREADEL